MVLITHAAAFQLFALTPLASLPLDSSAPSLRVLLASIEMHWTSPVGIVIRAAPHAWAPCPMTACLVLPVATSAWRILQQLVESVSQGRRKLRISISLCQTQFPLLRMAKHLLRELDN